MTNVNLFGEPIETPRRGPRIFGKTRRPRHCRVDGCSETYIASDVAGTHWYCHTHECDQDECLRVAHQRGRCKLHAYCAVEGCVNMRRFIQRGKYCEDHATSINYTISGLIPEMGTKATCVLCDLPCQQRRAWGQRPRPPICREHKHLGELLHTWRHRYTMSDEQMRALITEAVCWVCGNSVAWRFDSFGNPDSLGKIHVDHDHRCCPGESCCGNCIRGLAHQSCNLDIGHIEKLMRKTGKERMMKLVEELADP